MVKWSFMPDTAGKKQVKSILQRNGKAISMAFDHKQVKINSIHQQLKGLVMDLRYTIGKNEYKRMTTGELRDSFLMSITALL